jgi:hypothetical protein
MAIIKTLSPLTVTSGARMRLSDAQKLARAHIPSAVDADGWVVYSQDLSFKSGEEIELEIVPKGIDAKVYPDAVESKKSRKQS